MTSAYCQKFQIYAILDQVEMFVKSLSFPLKITVSHILQEKICELSKCATVETANKATRIHQAILSKKRMETPTIDLTRGARLTNMAKNSLDSLLNNNQKRGSQLNKSLPEVVKVKEFPELFGKPEKIEFVVVDTKVNFDKTKLSARQKEQLKRRRDDIPSLYMDLTQDTESESLSQNPIDSVDEEANNSDSPEKRYMTRRSLSLGVKNKQQKQEENDTVEISCPETEPIVPENVTGESLKDSVVANEEDKDNLHTSSSVTDAETEIEVNAASEEEAEIQEKDDKPKG